MGRRCVTKSQIRLHSRLTCLYKGRVNCLGTRLAKVEMKLITAMLLLEFDFNTVDAGGRIADPHPRPNWNDTNVDGGRTELRLS